jgi:hypothetical protein
VIHFSKEFHTLVQGDSTIANYCKKLKSLVDSLRDVGHVVSESHFVLNLLQGLNSKFSNTADNIINTTPFPSFSEV